MLIFVLNSFIATNPLLMPQHLQKFIIVHRQIFVRYIWVRYNEGLVRPGGRWEDNIKMDLREIGCGGMDWIDLAQDRDQWKALLKTIINLRVP
jgi:hypothetical protein